MPASVAEFSKATEDSGILTADLLTGYLRGVAPNDDARALANRLVKDGRLTAFQAKYIYAGKAASLVLGPYCILDMLGKGGMGYVYKAEHRKMRRVVALKVIAKVALGSPAAIQRFEREVQAAALLEHPNIVTAHDAGESGGTHYLVMQFVDGRNLSDVVKELGPQPAQRAVDWILQAAHGLAFAHQQGVIHRDIKPGNLLVDSRGTVKILDMGIARLESLDAKQDQLTSTGQVIGTVDYMSPEQALDMRRADARSDMYSLGATLWYLLVGRTMFTGETVMARMMAHLQLPPPSLRSVRDDITPELDAVFHRLVAKRPEDRFASMQNVIAALEPLVRSESGAAPSQYMSMGNAPLPRFSRAAVTETLQSPAALAGDGDTVRVSDVRSDSHTALPKGSRSGRPMARLKPSHAMISGAVICFVLLGGLLVVFLTGHRGDDERVATEFLAPAPTHISEVANAPQAIRPSPVVESADEAMHELAEPPAATHQPLAATSIAAYEDASASVPAQQSLPAPTDPDATDRSALPKPIAMQAVGDEPMPAGDVALGPQEAVVNLKDDASEGADADQLRHLIAELVAERVAIQDEVVAVNAIVAPLRLRAEQLRLEIIAGEHAIKQKTQAVMNLQRQRGNDQFAAEKAAQLTALANDISIMRQTIQPMVTEQSELLKQISSHAAAYDRCVTQLNSAYPRWEAVLSPLHRNYDTKLEGLSQAVGARADLPEASLWLAWLLWYGGDQSAASHAMETVTRLMASPYNLAPAAFPADFVFVGLLVDEQEVATKRLALFKQSFPKHMRIPYFEAIDGRNKKQWSTVKTKLSAALKRDVAEKDIGLNSDAALFFTCAPTSALRNAEQALECISRVIARVPQGTCNSLRAQAAVSAEAGDWEDALKVLAQAEAACPKPFLGEIRAQKQCYERREAYFQDK